MHYNRMPDQSTLTDWLHYDPLTGIFTWLKEPAIMPRDQFQQAGTSRPNGYVYISFPGHGPLAAHRLAWVYMHGFIPDGMEVDHKDGNPPNNAIANLRLATSSQQKMNKRVQSNNRSGLKGAYYHTCRKGKKWRSQIKVGEQVIFLGYFDTAEEAHAAYSTAAVKHFGEFSRVS